MISFRYHIVSVVSVFLALAIGIALGGGPLKGEVDNSLVQQVESDRRAKAELNAEIAALRVSNGFGDSFAETVAPGLIGNGLEGRPVTVVVLPGATQQSVTRTAALIEAAGGTVAGTYRVGAELLDVGQRQLVEELANQLLEGTPDVTVPADAGGYDRVGALVARAIATDQDGGAAVDESSSSIIAGLTTANLMSAEGEPETRGSLVVVVGGPNPAGDPQGPNGVLLSLLGALDASTDGVVLTGPGESAREGGAIRAVREDVAVSGAVSTVDSITRTVGQVVSVLALIEQEGGDVGHYGSGDAPDGAMPGATE